MQKIYHPKNQKSILIDFDGVLARLNHKKALGFLRGFKSSLRISPQEVLDNYFYRNPFHKEIDTGIMSYRSMLERIMSDCWCGPIKGWLEIWQGIWNSYDIDVELLNELEKQSDNVLIVTDNHLKFIDWFSAIPLLAPLSDQVLCSAITGFCKPDPRLFELALNQLDCTASNTLFIDDNKKNIQGARECGLHAIHFVDQRAALKTMREFVNSAR